MTNKNKTLSPLAAVGMTLYAAHWFAHRIPAVRMFAHSLLPTATVYDDAYYGAWLLILIATILLTIVIFIRDSKTTDAHPSISFRIVTYITCGIAVLSAVTACMNARDLLYVSEPLYPPFMLQLILIPLAIVWFWLLSRQQGIGRLSKAFRIAAIVGIVLLCLPLLRMTASAIYYCFTGYLLYFNTWASATNTLLFISTLLLTWYSIELLIYNRK